MNGVTRFMGAFALAAGAALSTMATAQDMSLIEKFKTDGVRVGIAGYAPYGYKQVDGSFTGEQVEVVQHVLSEMGITDIEYIAMDFGALIPSQVAGRIDLAAAGIYIRPERCEQVLFSEPTFGQGAAYVVKTGNPKGLNNFKDIAATDGAVLAVLAGGTEEDLAKRDGVPDEKLLKVSDKAAGIAAVLSGRADGFALSAFAIADIARTAGELIGVESSGSITDDMAAFAAFRDQFDAIQADYMASGGYAEMAAAWGFGPADGPALDMNTLCAGGL